MAALPAYSIPMPDAVEAVFAAYPDQVRPAMLALRELIFACAGSEHIAAIEETLKWGEPSYLAKHGSTLRIDWKPKHPDKIGVYFHCQTLLIETIKEVYGDLFEYEGNRAILLPLEKPLARQPLQHCMALALSYHKRKHKPLLGA